MRTSKYFLLLYTAALITSSYGTIMRDSIVLGAEEFFHYYINRSDFFPDLDDVSQVSLQPSWLDLPDLPEWLGYQQLSTSVDGILYGTPPNHVKKEQLEVYGLDWKTSESTYSKLYIEIEQADSYIETCIAIKLFNMDVTEFLEPATAEMIKSGISELWLSTDVDVRLRSLTHDERGGKGLRLEYCYWLPLILDTANLCTTEGLLLESFMWLDNLYPERIEVDWCHIDKYERAPGPTEAIHFSINLDLDPADSHITLWPRDLLPRRDFYVEFMVTFTFPVLLALAFVIVTGYAMFCRREGVDKRDELLTDEEIFQFDTIRRATINMRLMSNYRYGSSSLHPGSVYSTLERSATSRCNNSLPRNQMPTYKVKVNSVQNSSTNISNSTSQASASNNRSTHDCNSTSSQPESTKHLDTANLKPPSRVNSQTSSRSSSLHGKSGESRSISRERSRERSQSHSVSRHGSRSGSRTSNVSDRYESFPSGHASRNRSVSQNSAPSRQGSRSRERASSREVSLARERDEEHRQHNGSPGGSHKSLPRRSQDSINK